jgi:DtxR family transcriptional regulator, manganese transport regulator
MLKCLEMAQTRDHAARFRTTRDAHRNELAEDYVEAILELKEEVGEARVTDLADRLGIAHPTAAKTLRKLERENLVILTPYRPIDLTESGMTLAVACRKRHRIVVDFLNVLGLEISKAEVEAEGMEHHVSDETLGLMDAFVRRSRT